MIKSKKEAEDKKNSLEVEISEINNMKESLISKC